MDTWLKQALTTSGMTQAELSRRLTNRFNWPEDRSIINKILKGRRGLSATEAVQISDTTGYPLPAEIKRDIPEAPVFKVVNKEIDVVYVRGKVAANTWMDVDSMDFSYEDMETIPSLSGYPAAWQFGLRVDGNCLNKIAAHDDILVCLDVALASAEIRENDLVVVERKRYGGQMVERTAKRVRKTVRGFELWPESTDPNHQQPILLYEFNEAEEVTVIGKVLWILKKP